MEIPLVFQEKRIVIYGRLKVRTRDVVAKLELAGAHCLDKVNGRTDYVVIADSCSPAKRSSLLTRISSCGADKSLSLINEDALLNALGVE